MSNTKHTPGPWIHNTDFHLYKKDNYSEIKGGIGYFDEQGEEHGFNIAALMTDADAKLIAAAPELLEALIEITSFIDKEGPASKEWKAITECNEKAKAVIKKATE